MVIFFNGDTGSGKNQPFFSVGHRARKIFVVFFRGWCVLSLFRMIINNRNNCLSLCYEEKGGKKFTENVCTVVQINTKRSVDICRS